MKLGWAGVGLSVWLATGTVVWAEEDVVAQPPESPSAPTSVASESTMRGEVLETMDAGRYTYIRIEKDGQEIWAAGPHTKVAVGDQVELPDGLPMANFESPSLQRTFSVVYFVPAIYVEGQTADAAAEPSATDPAGVQPKGGGTLPEGHPDISGMGANLPAGHPDIGAAVPTTEPAALPENLESGTVVQVLDAGRYTYVEVKSDAGTKWIAAPTVALTTGQKIQFPAGMEMSKFESPTLGRKFDSIFFVTAVYPVAE